MTSMRGPSGEAPATHTPGPWRIYGLTVESESHGNICLVNLARPSKQTECNLRLIAAAPDLLAALQYFIKQWDACGPNSDFGRYFKNVRNTAVYAIAKAAQPLDRAADFACTATDNTNVRPES